LVLENLFYKRYAEVTVPHFTLGQSKGSAV
jgi:hypothetical protein